MEKGTLIHLVRTGGVAGPIRRPEVAINVDDLDSADRIELAELIAGADLDSQPSDYGSVAVPDAIETTLTVASASWSKTVKFRDGDSHPPHLDRVVAWLWARRPRL